MKRTSIGTLARVRGNGLNVATVTAQLRSPSGKVVAAKSAEVLVRGCWKGAFDIELTVRNPVLGFDELLGGDARVR